MANLFAQIRPSISNLLRYGNGEQSVGNLTNNFQYFENLTDVRLALPENLDIGFRFLYDDPPEVGDSFKGIKRRFVEYTKDNLNVRIGNSSELYGRGMVLNLFENRGLAYDTWIDGIKASYKIDNLKASLIAGSIDFRDSITVTRFENYKLRGGNLEYEIAEPLKIGASFISAQSSIPQIDKTKLSAKSELPEIYFDFNHEQFNWFLSWASKWTNTEKLKTSSRGNGLYSSFSFAEESFGITIDYKNYNFDLQDPYLQNDETRTTKFLPFQNPPIVMKEHSYVFLSRSLHEVDFNDEVGFQVDANYAINEDFNLNLNFSFASKHNFYSLSQTTFLFDEEKRSSNFLPSSEDKYSPYREIFLEGEYYFDLSTSIRLGIAQREKTIYNYFTGSAGSHIIKSVVVPLQFSHPFSNNFSALFQYEFESVNDNYNNEQPNFNNHFISLLTSIYRKATLGIRYEFTTNDFDISNRTDWLVTELGYRISGANLISVSYGRERGGQVCSNGICRYLLPFKGFKFNLQTNL
ncbi:MAG: hypothetical protein H6613_06175 [Ignavibacteriales bacterium]|nr:hypothetical protein [Ignavibacteriales bacterium]